MTGIHNPLLRVEVCFSGLFNKQTLETRKLGSSVRESVNTKCQHINICGRGCDVITLSFQYLIVISFPTILSLFKCA